MNEISEREGDINSHSYEDTLIERITMLENELQQMKDQKSNDDTSIETKIIKKRNELMKKRNNIDTKLKLLNFLLDGKEEKPRISENYTLAGVKSKRVKVGGIFEMAKKTLERHPDKWMTGGEIGRIAVREGIWVNPSKCYEASMTGCLLRKIDNLPPWMQMRKREPDRQALKGATEFKWAGENGELKEEASLAKSNDRTCLECGGTAAYDHEDSSWGCIDCGMELEEWKGVSPMKIKEKEDEQ